jgi:hypothetical protein
MKLFNSYLTLQLNGNEVYVILRGLKKNIEETFNSLYNFRATENPNLEFHSDSNLNACAGFWSSWSQLQDYFYNKHHNKWGEHNKAYLDSIRMIGELKKEQNHETFLKLHNDKRPVVFDGFNFGTIEKEETEDIKDAILVESFKVKDSNSPAKTSSESSVFPDKKNIQELMTVAAL